MNQEKEKQSKIKLIGFILRWVLIIFLVTAAADFLLGYGVYSNLLKVLFPDSPVRETVLLYITFLGTWTVLPLFTYLRKQDRPILKALGNKPRGNNLKCFLFGLLLGFGMNAVCAFAAWLNHDIDLHFDSFHPVSFLLVFIFVFIQSSAEELADRCFLYQKFLHRSGMPVVAIAASSLTFGMMHLFNDHITLLAVVNLVTTGVFYALMVYYMDSIWCAMAHHTAWNFTQNILLGLPNSGNVVPYSVCKVDAAAATSSLVYDAGFGVEGGLVSLTLYAAGCIILIIWGRKHGRKPFNVWEA